MVHCKSNNSATIDSWQTSFEKFRIVIVEIQNYEINGF